MQKVQKEKIVVEFSQKEFMGLQFYTGELEMETEEEVIQALVRDLTQEGDPECRAAMALWFRARLDLLHGQKPSIEEKETDDLPPFVDSVDMLENAWPMKYNNAFEKARLNLIHEISALQIPPDVKQEVLQVIRNTLNLKN